MLFIFGQFLSWKIISFFYCIKSFWNMCLEFGLAITLSLNPCTQNTEESLWFVADHCSWVTKILLVETLFRWLCDFCIGIDWCGSGQDMHALGSAVRPTMLQVKALFEVHGGESSGNWDTLGISNTPKHIFFYVKAGT